METEYTKISGKIVEIKDLKKKKELARKYDGLVSSTDRKVAQEMKSYGKE